MDNIIIARKLESLRRCLKRVEDKCPGRVEDLADDADLQDILVLNLTRAIQLCVDIASHMISDRETLPPNTMRAAFASLEDMGVLNSEVAASLKKAVGFRNIAVHNYEQVSWEIVFHICHEQPAIFQEFARAVVRYSGL